MRFGTWYPLVEAASHAPDTPGVFQVRIASGLIQYARGKSAMIHYAVASDLREAIVAFAASHPTEDWLCRHCAEFSPSSRETPEDHYERLRDRFTTQFGGPPRLP